MKRTFDLIVSALGTFLLLPVLLGIAFAVRCSSSGPICYRGWRAGRGGKPFRVLKFRTMVVNADQIGGPSTPEDDPRITRVGTWLRRYKLDELPQLINVLRGEMSFVGPRPEIFSETQDYTMEERRLFEVRPGITDWASIRFRKEGEMLRGSPDPHRTYREEIRPEKIRLGLAYIQHRSFAMDMKILFETLRVLLVPGADLKLPVEVATQRN